MFFISSIFPINLFFIIYIALHFQTIVYEKNQPELAHFILVKLVNYILALTVLQRLLSQAIDEYKKVNRIMGMEFSDRLKRVVDEYNNRRRDEAFANEVLDDVAEQLAKLLEELKKEKDSFKGMGIDYEEKAFYDILKAVAKKYEFEYPDDKMIELSKRIKVIVDDKAKYTDWSTRDDIKANLQVDLILLLDEFDYPPVTIDDVYKEVLEQAENFKKYSE